MYAPIVCVECLEKVALITTFYVGDREWAVPIMRSLAKRVLGVRGTEIARRVIGRSEAKSPSAFTPPEVVLEIISRIEEDPWIISRSDALRALRMLGLSDFGALMISMPNPRFAKLSRLLPAMASDEVQNRWTGASGMALLQQSLDFVRSVAFNYASILGRSLSDATMLDFGCGYGRISRLMYYFVEQPTLYGVDPWDTSIDLCHRAGLSTNYLVSDYIPSSLPVGDVRFDLVYAFSVFTHLSERATLAAMATIRKYIKENGVLVLTIRPIEYWRHDKSIANADAEALEAVHRQVGFAFRPHLRPAVDGDVTYGDTSMTVKWLSTRCAQWSVRAIDRSLNDPLQLYVFLQPA